MGEKIKTLSKGRVGNSVIEIELNHPPIAGADRQVHIQTSRFRFELDVSEYIRYAISLLHAEARLKRLKNID